MLLTPDASVLQDRVIAKIDELYAIEPTSSGSGRVNEDELSRAMSRSGFMLYPANFMDLRHRLPAISSGGLPPDHHRPGRLAIYLKSLWFRVQIQTRKSSSGYSWSAWGACSA